MYNVNTIQNKNQKRVACQNKSITFESIRNKKLAPEAINLLQSGNYEILSQIELSKYMKSEILNYISIEKADKILINSINKHINEKKEAHKKLIIDYYIYENDKEDKGKKSDKAKLYAGYLVFEFKLDKKLIYKIQTDYMQKDTSDIPDRMDCVIKSFITIKGE
ncbi:MAG: hypothetical protein C0625_11835 [Arcobacter sp.]|nr:MAG: hypothetical protein C0625_11835 [Arcobacter sp.]